MANRLSQHLFLALACAAACYAPELAAASTTVGAGGLPWESPLSKIAASLTGPVAYFISISSIAASAAGIIWGGDFGDFAKTGIRIALAVSILLLAGQVITTLFGIGAVIG